MTLHGQKGDHGYVCYDAKTCRVVKRVVWVNSESAQWGRLVHPITVVNSQVAVETVQEERITIYVSRKLVVFNEVDDSEPVGDKVMADVMESISL